MTPTIEELANLILALPAESRKQLVQLLAGSMRASGVKDAGEPYGEPRLISKNELSKISIDMKSVTVVLPDDLAKQAQAAGLLAEQRFEQLIRGALQQQNASAPSSLNATRQRRRLIRQEGRLVVEALPGERAITDAEVRDVLNKMDW